MRIFAFLAVGVALLAQNQTQTPVNNDDVRVLVVAAQPHQKGRLHQHTTNRVMVYLDQGGEAFAYQDGRKETKTWKAGQALWSPMEGMHTADIIGDKVIRIVEIELKKTPTTPKQASGPLDPVKIDPKHYKVEFENSQVRVVRVKIGPGEDVPEHEHYLNRVSTYLTDQDFQVTSNGTQSHSANKAGTAVWGTPGRHTEHNASNKPFEAVMVELKY